jgi:CTP:molybdopterin cytidylyltransferase MocA
MSESPTGLKVGSVLLAAGPSSRLGQPKQLVKVNGESLVRRSARILLEAGIDPVLVITGFAQEDIQNEIEDLPVQVVSNPEWALGMGGSIACGARNAPRGLDGLLVMACDQWRMESNDIEALVSRWYSDISRILLANWKEGEAYVSGPPVIFPRNLIRELKFIEKSRGARQVIDRFIDLVEFQTIENAAFDLDRPEDLERLVQP